MATINLSLCKRILKHYASVFSISCRTWQYGVPPNPKQSPPHPLHVERSRLLKHAAHWLYIGCHGNTIFLPTSKTAQKPACLMPSTMTYWGTMNTTLLNKHHVKINYTSRSDKVVEYFSGETNHSILNVPIRLVNPKGQHLLLFGIKSRGFSNGEGLEPVFFFFLKGSSGEGTYTSTCSATAFVTLMPRKIHKIRSRQFRPCVAISDA